ncbi:beta-1,3-galactosyltransferase pvg3-like [Lolium perenne]|uniref:beta-1,3-galactosyltransferase pvg3-like n=1 Tax=Lolium perenne TaxID=4522 RepID=UPI0021EAEB5F|nr:beta-1,3-galactosyltransferase pvg3-like [Lolium perenne]
MASDASKHGGGGGDQQPAMRTNRAGFPKLSISSKGLILLPLLLLGIIYLVVYPKEFELQALIGSCSPAPADTTANETAAVGKPDFRLLIGILTSADFYERRHLLRMVYGRQLASTSPPLAAQIDVRFVFCRLSTDVQRVLVPLEILARGDIIVLDACAENMDGGKTHAFFTAAASLYADAPYDYVMKADDDIFFRLPELAASLGAMPREDAYYGATIPCGSRDTRRGWYMSGMGYALSWDLVAWIAAAEDVTRGRTVGTEDRMVGEWLKSGGKAKNRFNAKPAMYDHPLSVPATECAHQLVPDTIAVHRLKDNPRWAQTLRYFNFTAGLQSSKFYKFDS